MNNLQIPENYHSPLTIRETEVAIKEVKDHFERALAKSLHLTRVSAPLFVRPESGLNDNLNGVERPVAFGIKEQEDREVEIVHSLAKWKRYALKRYGFHSGEGLYTDMSAIRRDEDTDNIHSIYVDQWDWEKVISKEERNMETLEYTVGKVYSALKETEAYMARRYNYIEDPVLDIALELSSMGIRVDEDALRRQLKEAGCEERAEMDFQKALLNGKLPYTVGGGIGQSRICMFYLRKAHIGEVQSSIWPDDVLEEAASRGVYLL